MIQEFHAVRGLFEEFDEAEQAKIKQACLKAGRSVESLMREGILEVAAGILNAGGPRDPDPEAGDSQRKAA